MKINKVKAQELLDAGTITMTDFLTLTTEPREKERKHHMSQNRETTSKMNYEDYIDVNTELIVSPQGHKAVYLGFKGNGNFFRFNGQEFSMTALDGYLKENKMFKASHYWCTENGIVPYELWQIEKAK